MKELICPPTPELSTDQILQIGGYAKAIGQARNMPRSRLLTGSIQSRKKGHGIELHEIRPYTMSDEARHIDWRVTARTGEAHTRIYTEESEHRTLILLDLSSDAYFGTQTTFISTRLTQLAALLAWRCYAQHEKVGIAIQAGEPTLHPMIRDWQRLGQQLAQATKVMNRLACKQSFSLPDSLSLKGYSIVVLSDQLQIDESCLASFTQLAQHNRVHWVSVDDPNAFNLPNGDYIFAGQHGKQHLKVNVKQKQSAQVQHQKLHLQLSQYLFSNGVEYLTFSVDDSPIGIARELLFRGVIR